MQWSWYSVLRKLTCVRSPKDSRHMCRTKKKKYSATATTKTTEAVAYIWMIGSAKSVHICRYITADERTKPRRWLSRLSAAIDCTKENILICLLSCKPDVVSHARTRAQWFRATTRFQDNGGGPMCLRTNVCANPNTVCAEKKLQITRRNTHTHAHARTFITLLSRQKLRRTFARLSSAAPKWRTIDGVQKIIRYIFAELCFDKPFLCLAPPAPLRFDRPPSVCRRTIKLTSATSLRIA